MTILFVQQVIQQPIPPHTHIHTAWELWLAFIGGLLLHTLKSAGTAVRNNAFSTMQEYLCKYWNFILVRSVLELVAFMLWVKYPGIVTSGLSKVGVSLSFDLPMVPLSAFFVGFFIDSGLDFLAAKIPWLKKEIPDIEQITTRTTSVNTALDAGMQVKKETVEVVTREKIEKPGT